MEEAQQLVDELGTRDASLYELVLQRKGALLAAFEGRDEARTGTVTVEQWARVMKEVRGGEGGG